MSFPAANPHSRRARLWTLVLALASGSASAQTTFFVRLSGSDAADGRTPAAAFRTISKSLLVAAPGDTVFIGAGAYPEALVPSRTGLDTRPIKFIADTDGTKTGDPGPVTVTAAGKPVLDIKVVGFLHFTGFIFSGGTVSVTTQNSSGILLKSCTMRAMAGDGISITNTSGLGSIAIERCTITGAGGHGLVINQNAHVYVADSWFTSIAGSGVVLAWPNSTLDLTRCGLDTIGDRGIDVDRGSAVISSVLLRACTNAGVWVGSHSSVNVRMANLTVASVAGRAVHQEGGILTMHNSIIAMAATGLSRAGGTATHDFNQYFGCTTTYTGLAAGPNDLNADPLFTSPIDLHPLSGSPAIDSGTDMSAITTTDLDSKPRPINRVFDRGCYEFGTAPSRRIIWWEETSPN